MKPVGGWAMSFRNETALKHERTHWSLRSELLASHIGLVLIAIVAFGLMLFLMVAHATYRRAEADLLAVAQELRQDLQNHSAPAGLTISDLYRHRFGMAPRDHAYIALWDEHGKMLYATSPMPDHVSPSGKLPPDAGPHPFHTRAVGQYFDVIVATPQGGQLLIGRPLAKEWDGLWWLLLRILGLGLVCLVGATLAAEWIARRQSKPLVTLANTAAGTSSHNLDHRIDSIDGSLEVVQLVEVFNQMLDRLQAAFEKQSRFVADASHELRTPVAILFSQAEHALHRERTPQDYRQALEVCLTCGKRMKRLIDELLFLARADAGKLALRLIPMDLSIVAAQSVELLQPLADECHVSMKTDLATAHLFGDPERLSQVIMNLLANAIRYNRPDGTLFLRTGCNAQYVTLEVRDNGIGIAPEDLPHLFDRFYRADSARTQDEEAGTGLGLSIVHEIVTAHQGTIEVRSMPGEGTAFTVRLPNSLMVAAIGPGELEAAREP